MTDSLFAVRQLAAVYGKVELECTKARQARAVVDWISADEQTGQWDAVNSGSPLLEDLERMFRLLYTDVLVVMDNMIYDGDLVPKHGPGATADRLRGNAKYDVEEWPERLDAVFPYMEYGIPALAYADPLIRSEIYGDMDPVRFPQVKDERPSRMVLVPKTMKTPRVIAAEPTALQFMQQAIARPLVRLLEDRGSLVSGMIGFTEQEPNQDMARRGSLDGSLATLDMSEASDRVSRLQVVSSVRCFRNFAAALEATRSLSVDLPSVKGSTRRETVPIQKFAMMGSALCFPMEAMVFLAAVFLGIEDYLRHKGELGRGILSKEDVESFRGSVRVFGDDIIVPVDCVYFVLDVFKSLGWKTNFDKSFWTGRFRESCGADYFDGRWVTPIRFRHDWPRSRRDVSEVAGLVSFRNQSYKAGMRRVARHLDRIIGKILPHYPVVRETSAILGRVSCSPFYTVDSMHPDFQSPRTLGYSLKARIPSSPISELGALLKCLIAPVREQDDHLERFGRPTVVDMKLSRSSPF